MSGAAARDQSGIVAYLEGEYRPLAEAKVSVMTHAFLYGTATFEGIRAYWNAEQEELYVLKLDQHLERLRASSRILMMDPLPEVSALHAIIVELLRQNGYREDVYIRPSVYKSTEAIGVRLHELKNDLYVIATPFGNYIDVDSGIRCATVATSPTPPATVRARHSSGRRASKSRRSLTRN